MPNPLKSSVLESIRARLGAVRKLEGSESLYELGDSAARLYFRYSRLHPRARTFFGLRDVDLRRLEGHNSFLCLLVAGDKEPLFLPYADFEEVFKGARKAKDGQYKAQLLLGGGARELYISGAGRFNLEPYAGYEALSRALDERRLTEARNLTHTQVQTLLAGVGRAKGYDVFVPLSDSQRLDWTLTERFPLRRDVPPAYDRVRGVLAEIDVVWISKARDSVDSLFEVEHSTTVYSGLLRLNDVLITDPSVSRFSIVADDMRRSAFSRQISRPTFRKSGLSDLCSFLEYSNVVDWHARLAQEPSEQGKRL